MSTNLPLSVAIPLAGGIVNGYITKTNIETWYKGLNKPSFTPPDWVFGPVWTTLYTAMGYGSHLIANHAAYSLSPETKQWAQLGLNLYYSQLVINFAWSPLFFKFHKIKLAAFECGLMATNVAAMIYTWWKVDRKAALLMVPYLGWISFATFLTYSIHIRNPPKNERKSD